MLPTAAAGSGSVEKSVADWDGFWRARGVEPAPPRDFIKFSLPIPEVLNLTNGAISDAVARRWAIADLKRGRGDHWIMCHLRTDVANAGVLGPPGLSGTDQSIEEERARGAIALGCEPLFVVEKIAVVAVSREFQQRAPGVGLTDFVLVIVSRYNGLAAVRTLSGGRKEAVPSRHKAGDLIWQLDAGNFREDPVVGPLWYQAVGWSCRPDGSSAVDKICRLVRAN